MKRVIFRDLIGNITRHLVSRPEYFDLLNVLAISPKDWPESKAKSIAETYISLRTSKDHDYAAHLLADDADKLPTTDSMPIEPNALKGLYADELRKHRLISFSHEMSILTDPDEIERAINRFDSKTSEQVKIKNFTDSVAEILEEHNRAKILGESLVVIPDWPILSDMIGGFNPGRVTILVANTGFGKTNLSLSLAASTAKRSPTLFVNMEMTAQDIGERLFMRHQNMTYSQLKSTTFDEEIIQAFKTEKIDGYRLTYTDGRSLSPAQIFSAARLEKQKGMRFLFIDYDQKIQLQTSYDTKEWKALQIAVENLEALAKELNIWVCLMAQSNDDGDPSGSKRSKYAASTVLRFYQNEDDQKYLVQAIKNRFGRHMAAIEVDYFPDKAIVKEKCHYEKAPLKPLTKRFGFER